MRRRAWDLAAAVSLLLFLATAVMWVSSYWWYDELGVMAGRQLFCFNSAAGETSWIWDTDYLGDARRYARRRPLKDSMYAEGMGHYFEHRFAGFAARYRFDSAGTGARGTMFRVLVVPYWFLLLAAAAAPAWWLAITRRRRRRVAGGLCTGCGYDLRASTGRCPECVKPF